MATTNETPKGLSNCQCGHVGDAPLPGTPSYERAQAHGEPIQHAGMIGHGACEVPGCPCEKFTWKEFIKGKN